jgi:hypothetical protein
MSAFFRVAIFPALIAAACAGPPEQRGFSVVVPTNVAEGHGDGHAGRKPAAAPGSSAPAGAPVPSGSPAPSGSSSGTTADHTVEYGTQPDPTPLSTQHQWDLTLHYAKGTVRFEGARPIELAAPAVTPRRMGRFAVELWVGKELVDRVRFDFPLLGADGPPGADRRPVHGEPRFSPGADTLSTVRVPASERATSASIVDRLSGAAVTIPWPPNAPGPAP